MYDSQWNKKSIQTFGQNTNNACAEKELINIKEKIVECCDGTVMKEEMKEEFEQAKRRDSNKHDNDGKMMIVKEEEQR